MTISKTLELILKRLDEIEAMLATLATHGDVTTTASHDEIREIQDTLDALYDELEQDRQRRDLTEIRQSVRRTA